MQLGCEDLPAPALPPPTPAHPSEALAGLRSRTGAQPAFGGSLAVPGRPTPCVTARSPEPLDGGKAGSLGSESTALDTTSHPLSEIPSPRSQSGPDEEAEAEPSDSHCTAPRLSECLPPRSIA